jgi:hypothetical protein
MVNCRGSPTSILCVEAAKSPNDPAPFNRQGIHARNILGRHDDAHGFERALKAVHFAVNLGELFGNQ